MWVRKLKSQKGNVVTLGLLILLPVIALGIIANLEHTRSVYGADLDLQGALNDATRSAAFSVDKLSQAWNNPMIVPDKAHMVFRRELAQNLLLDGDLVPTSKSGIKSQIKYVFIVFNGENAYGLPEGVRYSSDDLLGTSFKGTLPQTFTVTETDIEVGENAGIKTELNKPGCIALVSAEFKPLIKGESTGVRWSAAKITQ